MNEKIKTLKILHLAICAGTIIAYIVVGNVSMDALKIPEINQESVVFPGITVLAIALSQFLFQTQLKQIDPKLESEAKMSQYATASLVRWSILEGGAFVILFVKPAFLLLGMVLVLYLIFLMPTESRVKRDLKIFG